MTNYENEFVWHDGAQIKAQYLVGMAKKAGSYALAEHYLVSILAHGVTHGLSDYIDLVNEVRTHYQVEPIPVPKQEQISVYCMDRRERNREYQVRKCYQDLNGEECKTLLRECLEALQINHPDLFKFKNQWIGIYLVVRDRLDSGITQCDFLSLAIRALPPGWPKRLAINENVFKNMRRDFPKSDAGEAYFEMENNPQKRLCDTFWDILQQYLLTER